ncbi:E3 ubiquitin-protein ligase pub1 [Ciborinia camelliae]|nr:E3 ubiquitin-protein ligase pub1 [Ciborinia camelliae]
MVKEIMRTVTLDSTPIVDKLWRLLNDLGGLGRRGWLGSLRRVFSPEGDSAVGSNLTDREPIPLPINLSIQSLSVDLATGSEELDLGGFVRRAAPEPNKRALYVGGLDPRVTEDVLRQIFETTGHVQNVKIIPDAIHLLEISYGCIPQVDFGCITERRASRSDTAIGSAAPSLFIN